MPNAQLVPLTAPSLVPGYCFTTWQQLAIDLFTGAFGVIPSQVGLGYNVGQTVPSVDNQDKIWHRLTPEGALEGTYSFAFGKWVRKYRVPPGPNDEHLIWGGTLADLYSYDGGDGNDPSVTPPTPVTGSFWEADTIYEARMPIGAGTLPLSTTVISPGDLGGLELVSLSVAEMPPHTHTPIAVGQSGTPPNRIWGSGDGTKMGLVYPGSDDGLALPPGTAENPVNTTLSNTGGDLTTTPIIVKPHQNLPPYVTVTFAKRSIRAWVTV
jgi:microcystin-dependent protein